jgi:hypothetical protein
MRLVNLIQVPFLPHPEEFFAFVRSVGMGAVRLFPRPPDHAHGHDPTAAVRMKPACIHAAGEASRCLDVPLQSYTPKVSK